PSTTFVKKEEVKKVAPVEEKESVKEAAAKPEVKEEPVSEIIEKTEVATTTKEPKEEVVAVPVEKVEPEESKESIVDTPKEDQSSTESKKVATQEATAEKVEAKIETPKLGGPKVIDKIDLDAINQSTRPTKKAKASKSTEPVKN